MERTIDELIEAAAELDERTAGLSDRLAQVTARAAGEHGVEVTVNLDGQLIGLELTRAALRHGADRLAAEIYRLTRQAAAAALAAGIATVGQIADLVGFPADEGPAPVVANVDLDVARAAATVKEHW